MSRMVDPTNVVRTQLDKVKGVRTQQDTDAQVRDLDRYAEGNRSDELVAPMIVGHVRISGPTPSATLGGAAGTGGSAGVLVSWGSDHCFQIVITTGTSGVSAGTLASVAFVKNRANANFTVSANPHSSAAIDSNLYTTTRSTTGFDVQCRTSPGTGATLTIGFTVEGV